MRYIIFILLLVSSAACWATPITYHFHGVTTSIKMDGDYRSDPLQSLVSDDGLVVTNGDSVMHGKIVFDPEVWRDGAGGSGWGEVLAWEFTTEGFDYWGPGGNTGNFHYLQFDDNRFTYADELPQGGYSPDVAYLRFDFGSTALANPPNHFPIESFIGGRFFTALEYPPGNYSGLQMSGLEGVITKTWTKEVTEPSSLLLFAIGLLSAGDSKGVPISRPWPCVI